MIGFDIERYRSGYAEKGLVKVDGAVVVHIEPNGSEWTLQWPSRLYTSESLKLMRPIVISSARGWFLAVNRGGSSVSGSGGPLDLLAQLQEQISRPEQIATVKVDCDAQDIGAVVLSFDRIRSLGGANGSLSFTTALDKFNHESLRELFVGSAPPAVTGEFDNLVQVTQSIALDVTADIA